MWLQLCKSAAAFNTLGNFWLLSETLWHSSFERLHGLAECLLLVGRLRICFRASLRICRFREGYAYALYIEQASSGRCFGVFLQNFSSEFFFKISLQNSSKNQHQAFSSSEGPVCQFVASCRSFKWRQHYLKFQKLNLESS